MSPRDNHSPLKPPLPQQLPLSVNPSVASSRAADLWWQTVRPGGGAVGGGGGHVSLMFLVSMAAALGLALAQRAVNYYSDVSNVTGKCSWFQWR